jgi:hypothetical protein
MLLQTYLAWGLAPLSLFLFVRMLRRVREKLPRVICSYILFSIFFGCVHFLLYRRNPTLYQVKEAQAQSSAKGEISIEGSLEESLKSISSTNVILLEMAGSRSQSGQPVSFEDPPKNYPSRYPNLDLETRIRTTLVGPERNGPVYTAVARFRFTSDDHGIKKGTEVSYEVGAPDKMSMVLQEAQFIEAIEVYRIGIINRMKKLFEPGSFKAIQFSLIDFFYFAFSIVGVGEVIPATTAIRMLTLVQIVGGFILPLAIDNSNVAPALSKPVRIHPPPMNPTTP